MQDIMQAARPFLRGKYYTDAYVTLNAKSTHALRLLHFPHVEFCTYSFLLAAFLKQPSEDGIGNTEGSHVNAECNSK